MSSINAKERENTSAHIIPEILGGSGRSFRRRTGMSENQGTKLKICKFIAMHTRWSKKNPELPYKEEELLVILNEARRIMKEQATLVPTKVPVVVVGDIHGQFGDLQRIFDSLEPPPKSSYLFLGDYVDRGRNSLECIMLLLAYKIRFPNNIILLRGNHECAK